MKCEIKCEICNVLFSVPHWRKETAKFCSLKCAHEALKGDLNTKCSECGRLYHIKESQKKKYKRSNGYFCSLNCMAENRRIFYKGENNPNYKGKERDYDGYLVSNLPRFGRIKLHHGVTFETLEINKIPKGFQIHHRDCNINNNAPENLALLTDSDHRWLHKQFGNATLWAYIHNKVKLPDLIEWAIDEDRAKRLLDLNIQIQKEIGVFKQGELLETLEVDNQQPSLSSNTFEGSTTNTQVLTDNTEDSNSDTSALPQINLANFGFNKEVDLVKIY